MGSVIVAVLLAGTPLVEPRVTHDDTLQGLRENIEKRVDRAVENTEDAVELVEQKK